MVVKAQCLLCGGDVLFLCGIGGRMWCGAVCSTPKHTTTTETHTLEHRHTHTTATTNRSEHTQTLFTTPTTNTHTHTPHHTHETHMRQYITRHHDFTVCIHLRYHLTELTANQASTRTRFGAKKWGGACFSLTELVHWHQER